MHFCKIILRDPSFGFMKNFILKHLVLIFFMMNLVLILFIAVFFNAFFIAFFFFQFKPLDFFS